MVRARTNRILPSRLEPAVGLWLTAWLVICGFPSVPALAQQLPSEAAGNFRRAIERLRAQKYPAAEQLLQQLAGEFPEHADIREALAMVLVFQGRPESATPQFEKVVQLRPLSARAHQNLGANYLRLGRTEEAEAEFREALRLQPENATVQYNLGTLYLSQRRFEDALPYLREAHDRQPRFFENAHKLALCYFFLGRHAEAAMVLEELLPVRDHPAEFFILVGLNRKALGQDAAAREAFDQALDVLPSSPEVYESFWEMFFQLSLYSEAVPILERAARSHPNSYPIALFLARAYQGAGQLEEARQTAQTALEKWPTAELHHVLGEVNEALKQYEEAVRHFRRAAELEPSERNLFDLGYEFLAHWSWDAALTVFQAGLKVHPDSDRLWLGLGTAYFAQGDYNRATEALLKAAAVAPDNVITYHLLADAFPVSSGYTEAVQGRFRELQQRYPENPWANYYYGLSLARPPDEHPSQADVARAIKLLERSVALKPDLAEAHYQLGLLHSEQGEWESAVRALGKAVRLKPDYASAHYRLALAYRRTGKTADAKKTLTRYQELKAKQESALDQRASQTIRFVQTLKE